MKFTSFDASEISPKASYYHMIAGIAPRPIAFVSTVSEEGLPNLAPFSFFNAFSANPPVVGFCPGTKADGSEKDTYKNIEETGECVINMVSYEIAEQMKITAADFAPDEDEFEKSGLEALDSDLVKAPRVALSPFQMEARLIEIIKFRRDAEGKVVMNSDAAVSGTGNLIICEVLKFHIDESIMHDGQTDPTALDLVGRMGGSLYARASSDSIFTLD